MIHGRMTDNANYRNDTDESRGARAAAVAAPGLLPFTRMESKSIFYPCFILNAGFFNPCHTENPNFVTKNKRGRLTTLREAARLKTENLNSRVKEASCVKISCPDSGRIVNTFKKEAFYE